MIKKQKNRLEPKCIKSNLISVKIYAMLENLIKLQFLMK